MPPTLEQMAAKGEAKLRRKSATMATAYNASKARAISNYNALPFTASMKTAYSAGVQEAEYIAPDPGKWRTNWMAKVSGG
ncbi:hypothetical protein LCGC14_1254140 [marine sediment metagenome]|uniref:Uncharacterized protein n=1 Tax=marine sediment metagenome TaxID=412755 RepID=A0A0F9P645_9ZZZZ